VTFEDIRTEVQSISLKIMGGFHPVAEDHAPENCSTLLLIGPDEPNFWHQFKNSLEMQDGQSNPMDRWSERVITSLARKINAKPIFPFQGPTYAPFFQWALKTGLMHVSPIRLLVHNQTGLFVSFRGALAFESEIQLPKPSPSPCPACAAPCASACPVSAFEGEFYDVEACQSHVLTLDAERCVDKGCAARRQCPVGKDRFRNLEQSSFHMQAFLSSPTAKSD
jgi:ferredoxin